MYHIYLTYIIFIGYEKYIPTQAELPHFSLSSLSWSSTSTGTIDLTGDFLS